MSTEYSVDSVPDIVIFDVEKLGSVSGCGLNSNLKLIETSTPAVDPLNLIFPPFENDSG